MCVCVNEGGGNIDFFKHQHCSIGFLHGNCVSSIHDDFSQDVQQSSSQVVCAKAEFPGRNMEAF